MNDSDTGIPFHRSCKIKCLPLNLQRQKNIKEGGSNVRSRNKDMIAKMEDFFSSVNFLLLKEAC